MEKAVISLKEFLPPGIHSGRNNKLCPLNVDEDSQYLMVGYTVNLSHLAGTVKKEYSFALPKFITKDEETFEVLGLLQAEMNKTQNGCLTFVNSEDRIIRKVMDWFKKEVELDFNTWRWYIKVNINEPSDMDYKTKIEGKVVQYWLKNTKIKPEQSYPKSVVYTKETKNKILKVCDYGSLTLEYKSNLFSQILKILLKK